LSSTGPADRSDDTPPATDSSTSTTRLPVHRPTRAPTPRRDGRQRAMRHRSVRVSGPHIDEQPRRTTTDPPNESPPPRTTSRHVLSGRRCSRRSTPNGAKGHANGDIRGAPSRSIASAKRRAASSFCT
jgi:hypothetical protein